MMKIVLAEVSNGQRGNEWTFEQSTVVIGRDTSECHIVFDQSRWVSRRHAELRCQGGRWSIVDVNSRFGTFVDGQSVSEATVIGDGTKLQFGSGGPVLVVRLDVSRLDVSVVATAGGAPVAVELLDGSTGLGERVALIKPITTIGRDAVNDIAIEAQAVAVSRRHAEIRREDGTGYLLHDLDSFNGTLVNGQRITGPTRLYHDDRLQLGSSGRILRFDAPGHPAPIEAALANERSLLSSAIASDRAAMQTMVGGASGAAQPVPPRDEDALQLLMRVPLGDRTELSIGRGRANDIHLDGLQISKVHARIALRDQRLWIEDLDSTNGVHVNGARLVEPTPLTPGGSAQIGPFVLRAEAGPSVVVFDTRSKTHIDAIALTKVVAGRSD